MKRTLNQDLADGFIQANGEPAAIDLAKSLFAAKKWLEGEHGALDNRVYATYQLLMAFVTELEDRDWGVAVSSETGGISFYPPNK